MRVYPLEHKTKILIPHVGDKPLFFAIRKNSQKLWVKRKEKSDNIKEYAYTAADKADTSEPGKILHVAEKNGKLILSPENQGFELVDVEWKEFRQKMPLQFYCGIVENNPQHITYLFEHTETGETYEMHWSHFEKMLRVCTVAVGIFYEEWTMVRRRNRYTIVPVWLKSDPIQ